MFGRVLFAFVWVIIAAGLALPLYPRDVVTSTVAGTSDPIQLVAASSLSGCEDCPIADGGGAACQSGCACDEALPAAAAAPGDASHLTIRLIIGPAGKAGDAPAFSSPLPAV